MQKSLLSKGLVVGVILLFLSLAVQSSVATVLPIEGKVVQQKEEIELSGKQWKIYRNCRIDGWHYDIRPNGRIGFAFIVTCEYLESCTLDGAKGKIAVSEIIGFGFFGIIEWYWMPREEVRINGHFLLCFYREDLNQPPV